MGRRQIEKFAAAGRYLCCPLCGAPLHLEGTSLRCARGHGFAVAAKGYANFVPNQRPLKGYDRAFFEHRAQVMGRGLYDHVIEAVLGCVASALNGDFGCGEGAAGCAPVRDGAGARGLVVDAGCGEGSYAKRVHAVLGCPVFAFDIAKEAVQVAASGGNDVLWAAADLARIPVRDDAAGCLINVFTPANYGEFARVLAPGGVLVKVVPGGGHLRELRHAFRDRLKSEEHSNARVLEYFEEHCALLERVPVARTFALDASLLADVVRMTPVLFGVGESELAACDVDELTVTAEVLVGRVKDAR